MRSRVLASLAVLALVVSACGGATSSQSPGGSVAPAPTTGGASTEPSASAGGTAIDTLQMHWLGDCTCIWHPAAYETFSQAINFEMMFSNLLDRGWKADGTWEPIPDLAEAGTSRPTA